VAGPGFTARRPIGQGQPADPGREGAVRGSDAHADGVHAGAGPQAAGPQDTGYQDTGYQDTGAAYRVPETVRRMSRAAVAFLSALDAEQRTAANPHFGLDLDGPRREWTYLPVPGRPGLPLRALSDAQRKLAHELITASVSMEGYAKVVSIMALEHVRRALVLASSPRSAHLFDPERYCFRIFGDPDGRPAPWGWQLAGHHVSLNFTVAGDYLSPTPCMFGAVPASYGALAPLEHEETDGYAFVRSLSPQQRAKAVIWHRPPPDFATRLVPRIGAVELPDHVFEPEPGYRIDDAERAALAYVRSGPRGIGGADLTAEQLYALTDLVRRFAGRLPAEVADAELRRVDAAGVENLWFAWAGATERGERHYYRVQGPGLLIEHDNTQDNGNHVHSVWRVPGGDFGDDLLAAHYREEAHGEERRDKSEK
jgi:hypothetical protein